MILRALSAVAVLLAASSSVSQKEQYINAIFQFDETPMNLNIVGETPLKKVTMGMTEGQIQKIYDATQGRVNFKNIYRLAVPQPDQMNKVASVEGFSSFTDNAVPPPVVMEPFKGATKPDPELDGEWWIRDINAEDISDTATGEGVVIADCDAGYYYDATDIEKNLIYEDRYDFGDRDNPRIIDDGNYVYHGTAVTAIMSGVLDGHGTNGIAYDSKTVPLQNFNYSGALDDIDKEEATAACVLYAMDLPDVSIIVLENQTRTGSSETFVGTRNAVRLAIEAGVHVVSAAGNFSVELGIEQTDDTGSVIVGALSQSGNKAGFSNYGDRISVAAFGEKLKTLYQRDGSMGYFGGTSGATPQVAATVALMLEVNPDLTPKQVRDILEATSVKSNKSARVGGQLDVRAAVNAAQATIPQWDELERAQNLRQEIQGILNFK